MIQSIKLTNFRLFENYKLDVNNSFVILSGKNATGKTSILEAIYIASITKSHRTNDISDVISFNKEYSKIEINEKKNYKIAISKEGKSLFINNKEIKKSGEFIGNLNVCFIGPSDIFLINGTKQDRRKFLDLNISLLNKKYLNESSKYKKILSERNQMLKSLKVDKVMFDVLTNDLADSLNYIYEERIKFIDKLNFYLQDICKNMNIEHIELKYEPTYNPKDIKGSFNNKLESDLFYKVTQIGSHRDNFKILINNLDASQFASEGQSRIIYIVIKLALKKIITDISGEPILLLDDIFQALDKSRIKALTEYVREAKQVFITTTSVLEIPDEILKNAVVVRIEKGENK